MKFLGKWLMLLTLLAGVLLFSLSSGSNTFAQQEDADTGEAGKIFLPFISNSAIVSNQIMTEATDPTLTDPASLLNRTDQIIVRYHDEAQAAAVNRTAQVAALSEAAQVDLAYVREMADNAFVVKMPAWKELAAVNEIIDHLLSVPEVDYAEPDGWQMVALTPNDSSYGSQWHYFAAGAGTYGANLPGAWDITTGSASTVVAVIDTGIRNHAELAGRIVQGYDFIGDTLVANDGNGRDNDSSDPGDWVTSAENASGYFAGCGTRNSSWHGTHVAGTIGANSNNNVGVAGINWNAKIQAVRVLGKCGGYTSDIVDGIRWAAGLAVSGVPVNTTPADVINMSLGGSGACSASEQSAINAAVAAGTVVVVAAGNSNANAANYTPASCANVITVAATGRTGSRAYYSNYGAVVEISAPGGDSTIDTKVLSTLNSGTTVPGADSYASYQGTSMATPHVAGIVSLMLSVNPALTPAQVTALLQGNVTPFPSGSSCTTANCGPGIINAAAAVAAARPQTNNPPSAFAKSSPATGGTTTSSTTLSWGASVGAASYEYCVDTTNDNLCSSWSPNGTATSATVSGLVVGSTYYWQVHAVNINGSTEANSGAWWSFTVQAAPLPGAFNKSSPANNSTGVNRNTTVRWNASSGATSYEYCVATTNNACTNWKTLGVVTQVSVSGLNRNTTYYWQVRAVNLTGTTNANGGTWWSFRTR